MRSPKQFLSLTLGRDAVVRLLTALMAAQALAPAAVAHAQAGADEVEAGAETKKVEKKQSLVEEEKKAEAPKAKRDEDKLVKGSYSVDQLEAAGFDDKQKKVQLEKSKIRQQQIETLNRLIDRNPRDPNMPDYLFRLAEAWWEEIHFDYLIKRLEWSKAVDAWEKSQVGPKPTEPVEDYARAIGYYEKILQQYPAYGRLDEVLYRLGKAALQQGKALGDKVQSTKGQQYLNQLVQKYPTSRYVPQAHLALAEHFFDANNLTLAKMNYEKLVQNFKTSPMYNYAQYKLGWVYFNLREFRRTIETWQSVVKDIGNPKDRGVIEFKEQALGDLVSAYAELERGWPEAKDYFKSVEGEPKTWARLEKLAGLYIANDKDELAIELLSHFLDNRPTDVKCVDWHESIVDVRKKIGNFPDTEAAMRKFLAFIDERSSPWVQAHKKSGEPYDKAQKMGENYLLFMSNYYHQMAQKTEDETKDVAKANGFYAKAAADYTEFLRRYPSSSKSYIVSFYLAEIYYDQLKDYQKALEGYERTIALDPGGEYVEDAALGAIYAVEELMRKTKTRYNDKKGVWEECADCPPLVASVEGDTKVTVTRTKEKKELTDEEVRAAAAPRPRQELHPLEKSYVAAADKYVDLMVKSKEKCQAGEKKFCNKGKKVPEIMYLGATAYYERGQYKEAVDRLEIVYKYDTDNKVAEIAVKTIIDVYARQKDWPKIEEWADLMLKRKKLFVFQEKDLKKYVAIAMAEQGRELAEKKDYAGAHAKYDAVIRRFRAEEPELAATAMFNKGAIYELEKEDKVAIETYERVVKDFPKSRIAPEAKFAVGMLYEAMTNFREAADAFLDMAKFRDNADAAQALINAGAILNALQEYKAAAAAYDKFISVANALKGDDDKTKRIKGLVADAEMEKGHVLEKLGAEGAKAAATAYNAVVARYPDRADLHTEALARKSEQLRLANAAKNRKEAIKAADEALKAYAKPAGKAGKAAYYAAQAMFFRTEYDMDDFRVLSLKNVKNMKGLLPVLQGKAGALKKAETNYFQVVDQASAGGGRAWAAAAAFRVGQLYFEFKEDLFNAPIPPQIQGNVDLEDAYRQEIEKLAVPIEEQSVAALRSAIQIAHNLGVYNTWSKQAGDLAATVNRDEYPTVEKDPNLPKAASTVSANKSTDPATSAAFVTTVRRGKFTVSYSPKSEAK